MLLNFGHGVGVVDDDVGGESFLVVNEVLKGLVRMRIPQSSENSFLGEVAISIPQRYRFLHYYLLQQWDVLVLGY